MDVMYSSVVFKKPKRVQKVNYKKPSHMMFSRFFFCRYCLVVFVSLSSKILITFLFNLTYSNLYPFFPPLQAEASDENVIYSTLA